MYLIFAQSSNHNISNGLNPTWLKIIEILLKGCNNAENFVQKCRTLIIQNAPIIMEHIKKFLEKRDFCNSIHVCGGKSVRAGSQILRSLSSA
ncbi:hypothetical protein SORBI_3009G097250 [Sorghum bicolor]|uniref:Saposin B-type domain-containing protein n=1 Tax=Sorghum bicolor TaxID=4558 RepID=A0A1Z5R1V1_SORBI|nr:hypothetical protein SORBI_3009G097250 [Sorghum bicolor]